MQMCLQGAQLRDSAAPGGQRTAERSHRQRSELLAGHSGRQEEIPSQWKAVRRLMLGVLCASGLPRLLAIQPLGNQPSPVEGSQCPFHHQGSHAQPFSWEDAAPAVLGVGNRLRSPGPALSLHCGSKEELSE